MGGGGGNGDGDKHPLINRKQRGGGGGSLNNLPRIGVAANFDY